jgi:hypothetical protein
MKIKGLFKVPKGAKLFFSKIIFIKRKEKKQDLKK